MRGSEVYRRMSFDVPLTCLGIHVDRHGIFAQ